MQYATAMLSGPTKNITNNRSGLAAKTIAPVRVVEA